MSKEFDGVLRNMAQAKKRDKENNYYLPKPSTPIASQEGVYSPEERTQAISKVAAMGECLESKVVQLARIEAKICIEADRIVNTVCELTRTKAQLAELVNEHHKTAFCASCGFVGNGFKTIAYTEGDFDAECPRCKSNEVEETMGEVLSQVLSKRDDAIERADKLEATIAEQAKVIEGLQEKLNYVDAIMRSTLHALQSNGGAK